jgi:hypothetical protein
MWSCIRCSNSARDARGPLKPKPPTEIPSRPAALPNALVAVAAVAAMAGAGAGAGAGGRPRTIRTAPLTNSALRHTFGTGGTGFALAGPAGAARVGGGLVPWNTQLGV